MGVGIVYFCERLGSEYQKGDARPFLLGVVFKNIVRCLTAVMKDFLLCKALLQNLFSFFQSLVFRCQ